MAASNDKIVLAVDDSVYAEDAFEWYFQHMHRPGNTLVLVHCLEFPSMPSRDTWEIQTKAGREKGMEVQEKFSSKCHVHGVQAKFCMDFEKPGEYICHVAKEENGTVIVMGTRGMGKVRRTILGSVSHYVLHHANCPVLVVRPQKEEC